MLLCYLGSSERARSMPVQPHLFPDSPAAPTGANQLGANQLGSNPEGVAKHPPPHAVPVAPIWLQRLSLFILVVFCIYLGVIVTVLPWWSSVWDRNLFLTSHSHLWSVLRTGPARGVVSGVGLLDIWIGISEAIHYHDQRN